jgi:hypothetical protein
MEENKMTPTTYQSFYPPYRWSFNSATSVNEELYQLEDVTSVEPVLQGIQKAFWDTWKTSYRQRLNPSTLKERAQHRHVVVGTTVDIVEGHGETVETASSLPFAGEQIYSKHLHEEDLLDWDAVIHTNPARPAGNLRVRLEYVGRSKPLPVDDPWQD